MDGQRFDRLTLWLATPVPRRRVTGVLVMLGLSAGREIVPTTEAKKKGKNKKKCKKGTIKRGKKCVNAMSNALHCGGCGEACDPGQDCVNGDCVAVCDPPCGDGRTCHLGNCTCRGNFDCELEQNPNGTFCLGTPPICGCPEATTVCAAGESCSPCCNDETCAINNPGFETIICSTVPPNVLGVRTCCVPTGGECGGNQQCCSGFCQDSQCVCIPTGSQEVCVKHEACCSGVCSGISRRCL